jgi:hypoxanthine phosphoribosyltransferase
MPDKLDLSFVEISRRLKNCALPPVDRVVGIGSGGVVPASLVAYELELPLNILSINLRAPDNSPRHPEPVVLNTIDIPVEDRRLLLVDDVSVSGATLAVARDVLAGYQITTLVLKGRADIVLFPEIADCVNWPWKAAG